MDLRSIRSPILKLSNASMGEKMSLIQSQHSASRKEEKMFLSRTQPEHIAFYISLFSFFIHFVKALSQLSSSSRHYLCFLVYYPVRQGTISLNPELFVLLSCSLFHPVSSRVHISIKTAGINSKVTIYDQVIFWIKKSNFFHRFLQFRIFEAKPLKLDRKKR